MTFDPSASAAANSESNGRIFFCLMPTGFWWTDKEREEHGDYAKLAFLPFSTLELEIFPGCPGSLRGIIEAQAANLQARSGEAYPISGSGQTIVLGHARKDA